ncbi:ribonuclease T2 family protein [Legionella londiniensis]|uniref:Ribonuclease, T2 family n=1 Tax=Legionella londiniensis TaxID=45068 RepID=A0A0W0VI21_9GAMM|nr:hypothetical protein [Legionella londiniensis]KTD19768.1 ribonuclease, T2 family [Legionella londiniensis]STX92321.1 ribonuclease, T2 family [Legionella londiniensis]
MLRFLFFVLAFLLLSNTAFSNDPYPSYPLTSCDKTPGMADSHVLALSWLPAFCDAHGYEAGYAECLDLPPESFHAKNLVLHGLWPNEASCGMDYNFCDAEIKANHCDYPSLSLPSSISKELQMLMPSYAYGGCLERHEWHKHGSCQLLPVSQYFALALRLTREAVNSPFGNYLSRHSGKKVKKDDLLKILEQSFGKNTTQKIYLGCRNGMLVDVYINLPALIPYDADLKSLVQKADKYKKTGQCPKTILISDFTAKTLRGIAS